MTLTALAYGPDHVYAYSHMNNLSIDAVTGMVSNAAAGQYACMGVRNDDPTEAGTPFTAADSARPRAARLSLQRLASLLSFAARVEVVTNADGLVVIHLTGRGAGFPADASGALLTPSCKTLGNVGIVAWLSDEDSVTVVETSL